METSRPPAPSGEPIRTPAPHPTTFVQADPSTFKEVVQRLTGPHDVPSSSTPIPKHSGIQRPAFKLHERRQANRSRFSMLKPLISPRPPVSDLGFYSPGHLSPLISPSTQLPVLSLSEGCAFPPPFLPPVADLGFYSPGHLSSLISPSTQFPVLSLSEGCVLSPPLFVPKTIVAEEAAATTTVAVGTEVVEAPELNVKEEEKAIRERRFYLHPSPRSGSKGEEPKLLPLFPLTSPKADSRRGEEGV